MNILKTTPEFRSVKYWLTEAKSNKRIHNQLFRSFGMTIGTIIALKSSKGRVHWKIRNGALRRINTPVGQMNRDLFISTDYQDYIIGNRASTILFNMEGLTEVGKQLGLEVVVETLQQHLDGTCSLEKLMSVMNKSVSKNVTVALIETVLTPKIIAELRSGKFSYATDKQRYTHPLQNMRSDLRGWILAYFGYKIVKDMNAMAVQATAKKLGWMKDDCTVPGAKRVQAFVKNRKFVRAEIADVCNITMDQSKTALTSLIFGARYAVSNRMFKSAIGETLGNDKELIGLFKLATIEYKSDLTEMYNLLSRDRQMELGVRACLGKKTKTLPQSNAKTRAKIYNKLEKEWQEEIQAKADSLNIKVFFVLDCVYAQEEFDLGDWVHDTETITLSEEQHDIVEEAVTRILSNVVISPVQKKMFSRQFILSNDQHLGNYLQKRLRDLSS